MGGEGAREGGGMLLLSAWVLEEGECGLWVVWGCFCGGFGWVGGGCFGEVGLFLVFSVLWFRMIGTYLLCWTEVWLRAWRFHVCCTEDTEDIQTPIAKPK